MSRSPITTNPDWLHNTHPGEMLLAEFMEPLSLDADQLAEALDLPSIRINALLAGERPIDADLDLRLGRYFRLSEGFFMQLQVQHDIIEAKRQLNGKLDRIVPRPPEVRAA